jgi:hypothetical protein
MARYWLKKAAYIDALSRRLPRGATIADTSGNAIAGDVVAPMLCTPPIASFLAPLDAAGQTALGVPTQPIGIPSLTESGATGVDSV